MLWLLHLLCYRVQKAKAELWSSILRNGWPMLRNLRRLHPSSTSQVLLTRFIFNVLKIQQLHLNQYSIMELSIFTKPQNSLQLAWFHKSFWHKIIITEVGNLDNLHNLLAALLLQSLLIGEGILIKTTDRQYLQRRCPQAFSEKRRQLSEESVKGPPVQRGNKKDYTLSEYHNIKKCAQNTRH